MYLQQLRQFDVRHNRWPAHNDVFMLNACFDIADATLNSWKEAHDAFSQRGERKADHPRWIGAGIHQEFARLVVKAFQDVEDDGMRRFAINVFPRECIAYAVLVAWVEQEIADAKTNV